MNTKCKVKYSEEVKVNEQLQEEIKFKCVCHLFPSDARTHESLTGFSYCGVPRCEQPRHGTAETGRSKYCSSCGLERCQRCYDKRG